jgi:hypothetical protein
MWPGVRGFRRLQWVLLAVSLLAPLALAQDNEAQALQVQEMYVAYYGRPGDPGGVAFWADQLQQNNGDLAAIIDAFGNSQEYTDLFASLPPQQLINNIYQQLFGRDADAEGLAFYLASLESGERTLASIALDVSNGVQPGTSDAAIVDNKLAVASYFTEAVATLDASYGSAQIAGAKALMSAVGASEDSLNTAIDAVLPLVASYPVTADAAFEYFVANVSDQVLQSTCIACHVAGGAAQASRLIYVSSSNPDYHSLNYQQWVQLATQEPDISNYALTKAQGINHGGGVQAAAGSDAYLALEQFLALLSGEAGDTVSGEFFQGFALTDSERTYRRAAMLVAGELPPQSSLDTAAAAADSQLRTLLRELLQGEGFHEFLIVGANDRLLTDKWIEDSPVTLFFQPYFPDLANAAATLSESEGNSQEIYKLVEGISFGIAREPLELIARVVEEDLPYTEILTADYTMVNPQLALAYRSTVDFADDDNIDQWQVATMEGYTRIDQSTMYEKADQFGAYVSGGLATEYPHAGVLNSPGWLARYPSTATNRNRARSRWTWYHFLGFDIERSAPRTTDPAALSDTDNPTLNNPNCVVCHEVMDPLAGSYQNYGDEGFYKDQPGGLDSLPALYKRDRSAEDPYQSGDTWYRDMREPGFDGAAFTNSDNSLQSLAAAITQDHRFAVGTVKFWWPALMGEEPVIAPQDSSDANYSQQLALFQAQSADIEALASAFEDGINGGAPYNLRDLLVEMMMSDWFRVDRLADELALPEDTYLALGTGKLLTPEELDRKTRAVTGFRWYESESRGVISSQLLDAYRLFYGGIDSDGVTRRATEMTALMSTVVEAQPLQMACVLVGIEFNLPLASRKLFSEVSRNQHEANALTAVRKQIQLLHERFLGESLADSDPEIDRALSLFTETRAERIALGYPPRLNGNANESCPFQFLDTSGWDLQDSQHSLNSWISLLIYYMTDYRYVYQ